MQDTTVSCLLSPDLILNNFNAMIPLSQIPLIFWSCGAGHLLGIYFNRLLDSYVHTRIHLHMHTDREETQRIQAYPSLQHFLVAVLRILVVSMLGSVNTFMNIRIYQVSMGNLVTWTQLHEFYVWARNLLWRYDSRKYHA